MGRGRRSRYEEGLYRGVLASRVKLHEIRQILINCSVVPGGERENGNEATLIKSGERIRSHSLDKAAALAEEHLGWDLQGFGRLHSVCPVIQSNFRRISAARKIPITNPTPHSTEIVTTRMLRAAIDAGPQPFMISVYNYMASGLALTGIVAYGAAETGVYASLIDTPMLFWGMRSVR
jgi:hypothetical protein